MKPICGIYTFKFCVNVRTRFELQPLVQMLLLIDNFCFVSLCRQLNLKLVDWLIRPCFARSRRVAVFCFGKIYCLESVIEQAVTQPAALSFKRVVITKNRFHSNENIFNKFKRFRCYIPPSSRSMHKYLLC